jgi:mono/diheme cytochrome c family protein
MSSRNGNAIVLILLVSASLIGGTLHAQDATTAPSTNPANGNTGTQIKNATSGVSQDRSSKSPAEALFVEKCSVCHRQMGMGTVILARRMDPAVAMLEARRDMPEAFIVQVTRAGIGNMPRISRGEVSDAQLAVIARYLARKDK